MFDFRFLVLLRIDCLALEKVITVQMGLSSNRNFVIQFEIRVSQWEEIFVALSMLKTTVWLLRHFWKRSYQFLTLRERIFKEAADEKILFTRILQCFVFESRPMFVFDRPKEAMVLYSCRSITFVTTRLMESAMTPVNNTRLYFILDIFRWP